MRYFFKLPLVLFVTVFITLHHSVQAHSTLSETVVQAVKVNIEASVLFTDQEKAQMFLTLDKLVQNETAHSSVGEVSARMTFVGLQGMFELAFADLAAASKLSLFTVYHTPAPPTPFCFIQTKGSLHPTVQLRIGSTETLTSVRQPMLLIYTEHGHASRTTEQLRQFETRLADAQSLISTYVLTDSIAQNKVGATYVLKEADSGEYYYFAIGSAQIHADNADTVQHQLTFGALKYPQIQANYSRWLEEWSSMTGGLLEKDISKVLGEVLIRP